MEDKIGAALKKLEERKVISAPVVYGDKNINCGKFVGLLELSDIVTFSISLHQSFSKKEVFMENLDDLLVEGNLFFGEKVSSILERKAKEPYHVEYSTPLLSIIEEFSSGHYRAGVVLDDQGFPANIISQSDVIRFLAKNSTTVRGIFDEITVEDLFSRYSIGSKDLKCVTPLTSVMEALQLINSSSIGAVAVVEDKNTRKIIANFSSSDIRVLSEPWNYRLLGQHVKNFLELLSKKYKTGPITCTLKDSLDSILNKMAQESIHRIYVVDDGERVNGVISFTDVMKYCMRRAMIPEQV